MRTLKIAIVSALACCTILPFTTVGAGATNGDQATSALQQIGSIETASTTEVLDLYKALDGDGPVTGTERSDVLASFNSELTQAVDSIADAKEAEAKQIALGKEDPKAAATVAAKGPDTLSSLIDLLTNEENAAKARLSALKSNTDEISIAQMFEMQMLMNHLSQLSEMTTAFISAANSSIQSMARNVKG
jgi:hypothetical protein